MKNRLKIVGLVLGCLFLAGTVALAQNNLTTGVGLISISLGTNNGGQNVDMGIKVLFLLTLLSLAPSLLLLLTCFTRIVIVLSFVRSALQLQGSPASQIIIGLSLFMTYFIMAPVWENINRDAIVPIMEPAMTGSAAGNRPRPPARTETSNQPRPGARHR